ncbi:MAG: hypothetical protein U0802_14160 [Candidatus Binatia bacterium]
MSLLPPSTNDQYAGALLSARFLAVLAVLTIIPGCIHTFLPDGGAGRIAGIDLGICGPTIIALFAWAGATQIALGLVMLVVSLRYRSLVPLMLAVVLLERSLHALCGWVTKAGPHHPPEHYAVLVGLPLLLAALVGSLREPAA